MQAHEVTQADFNLHFDSLAALALRPPISSDTQWFQSGIKDGQLITVVFQLKSISENNDPRRTFTPSPDAPQLPDWINPRAETQAYTLDYSRTRQVGSTDPKPIQRPMPRARPIGKTTSTIAELTKPEMGVPLTLGRVCLRFMSITPDLESVNRVVSTYVNAATDPIVANTDPKESAKFGEASATRILKLTTDPDTAQLPDTTPAHIETIASLDATNPHHSALLHSVAEQMGEALIGEGPFGQSQRTRLRLQRSAIDLVRRLEEQGLLSDSWWANYGIMAGAVNLDRGLLATAHAKIAADQGAEVLKHINPDAVQTMLKHYIGNVLKHYAEDDTRDVAMVKRFIEVLCGPYGAADPNKVLVAARAMESSSQNPRTFKDMRDLGDALLLLLKCTRKGDDQQQAEQFEQDILHVEIIDILHHATRDERTKRISERMAARWLHERFLGATPADLKDIARKYADGTSPLAVRAQWRARRGGGIQAWKSAKRGYGYFS